MTKINYKGILPFFVLLVCLHSNFLYAQQNKSLYPLIPYPTTVIPGKGNFIVNASTKINTTGTLFQNEVALLNELFVNTLGNSLPVTAKPTSNSIIIKYDPSVKAKEGYRLSITAKQITLSASTPEGMFMAVQTIRQLLPVPGSNDKNVISLPAIAIQDEPLYAWRGMHLDVSRHFFSIAYLKKYIDLMALYKFNKFHLHLTDDQGWRIEIKKYPKLTEEGAWRTFNNQDSACMKIATENPDFIIDPAHITTKNGKTVYGGFYTQEEMKTIVAYAAARHIEIVPEIDMPGHMMAAIDSYNYLSCDGKSAFGELFSIPICPCLPATFQFAQDIFTEIMNIFPSPYIHIGGDEVDRSYWEKSPACAALMQKEGLKNTAEIQSFFIRKMEAFFNSKGRKLIGWDEILEGGVSKTASIMYWRTWVPKAPVIAAKNGNPVIMTPGNPLYFSQQPDKNSLSSVYHYNVIPDGLTAKEAKNIIGGQANLWTEMVPTEDRADYLVMPSMTALAENLWNNKKDYTSYLKRLQQHYPRLDQLQVNYRLPNLPLMESYAFTDSTTLNIEKPLHNSSIRYTLDSTLPTINSTLLAGPLTIKQSQIMQLAIFKADGTRGDVYDISYKKQPLSPAEKVSPTQPGLLCYVYKKYFGNTTLINGKPDSSFIVPSVTVIKQAEAPSFALQYKGYIDVPEDGIYSFFLTCDDGGVLKIAGNEVVNNDGMHAPKEKNGQAALKKGLHTLELNFVEGGGGYTLKLQYSKNGAAPQDIPALWFKN